MTALGLRADQLCSGVDSRIVGREIVVLETTTSTNDAVWERALPSTPEGLVVFAEHQSAGRGQRNNSWESAAGKGLWFSVLLRPDIDVGESPRLAEWAAQNIAETISAELNLPATVKLPNDVLVSGKKVAGVLVEMRAQKNARHIAIVGIGINVNHAKDDFSSELRTRASSLAIAFGTEVDRQRFANALLRNLDRTYGEGFAR